MYTEIVGKNSKMEVKKPSTQMRMEVGRYGGRWGHATKQKSDCRERCRWKQPARCSHVGEAPAFSHRSLSLHSKQLHKHLSSRCCFSGPQRQMSPDRLVLLHGWMSKKPAGPAIVDV